MVPLHYNYACLQYEHHLIYSVFTWFMSVAAWHVDGIHVDSGVMHFDVKCIIFNPPLDTVLDTSLTIDQLSLCNCSLLLVHKDVWILSWNWR